MTKICEGCERPIRGNRDAAADHPGTVVGHGGLCNRCHWRRRNGKKPTDIDPPDAQAQRDTALKTGIHDHIPITIAGHDDPDPKIRDLAQQAEHFLEARRSRDVPPQGVEVEEVAA